MQEAVGKTLPEKTSKLHKASNFAKINRVLIKSLLSQKNEEREEPMNIGISVTRLGEISPLWQNFKSIWAPFKSLIYYLAKLINLHLQIFYAIA